MDVDYELIGKRLKTARMRNEVTQIELAEQMDISVAYLSRVETGKSPINLKRLIETCNILNVEPSEILTGTNITSDQYLDKEWSELLKDCPKKKKKILFKIVSVLRELDI